MKKQIALFSIVGALLISVIFKTEININRTQSLPYSVFLVIKGLPVSKGNLVSIKGHGTKYFQGLNFTKRIVGVAGERTAQFLNDLKTKTKRGLPLTPLSIKQIPEGAFFVNADHPDSIDSRYAEFGLVSIENIDGRSFPLW